MSGGDTLMLNGARQVLRNARLILRSGRRNVVIAADFTRQGDMAYRLAGEIRQLTQAGSTVSLLQTRRPTGRDGIAGEILTCLRRGLAQRTAPGTAGPCDTLILHRPARADDPAGLLERVVCERLILVCHGAEDIAAVGYLEPGRRDISVFATNPFLLDPQARGFLERRVWTPVVEPHAAAGGPTPPRRKTALCWLTDGATDLPGSWDVKGWPALEGVEQHVIGGAPRPHVPRLDRLSLDRVLSGVDIFVAAPGIGLGDLPDATIAAALGAERPVVLPSGLRAHYGAGPLYCADASLPQTLVGAIAALRSGGHGAGARRPAEFVARCAAGPIMRLRGRIGRRSGIGPRPGDRPVLFIPSNGVGVGHLTRLLAIARRMERKAVFASQAPALQVIRDFGFAAEYIPSHAAVGGDFDAWDAWFGAEIGRVADAYDPALTVFDGNHLTPGLIHAVASRRDCRLAWVRRGMWARTTSRFLANATWCDLVIEPEDLAGARDDGATSLLRHQVHTVDPIRLLDPAELPDRRSAAKMLQLDPGRPACLLQLGSGHNRDLLSLLDRIIQDLRRHPNLQIAVAEWVTGSVPLSLWPEVTVLRGFPVNQYVRAFDFCVSAAGYNSFHELIAYRVPTIFLANRSPDMDDQYGRAKFAQDNAAAFEISDSELGEFPDLVAMMMQAKAREFLVARCARLARPNGAMAAAKALGLLADTAGGPL